MAEDIEVGSPGWQQQHLELYLKTDGAEGHLMDLGNGHKPAPCLILKTIGRKSGEPRMNPLLYGKDGPNYIIVASKGGAPNHPAWYLNLEANPDVEFQVVNKKFKGTAETVTGPERQRLYAIMEQIYPPYTEYQANTKREIPVVLLKPTAEIAKL